MRTGTIWIAILGFLAVTGSAMAADTYVHGYTKSNGTYVAPYMRKSPDSTINNNYSTKPNVNPYTGQEGTRAPNPYQPVYPAPAPGYLYGTP